MKDRIVIVSLIIFAVIVFWHTDFSAEAHIYDCTGNLNKYPRYVAEECRGLIEEFRRQEEQKGSKIYI